MIIIVEYWDMEIVLIHNNLGNNNHSHYYHIILSFILCKFFVIDEILMDVEFAPHFSLIMNIQIMHKFNGLQHKVMKWPSIQSRE